MDWDSITNPFGTHRRVLKQALQRTSGPVLELGAGHESTPYLHEFCLEPQRHLVTCECDPVWHEKFVHLQSEWHEIILVSEDYASAPVHSFLWWSVALLDHTLELRKPDAIRLANHAEVVVIHDTEMLDLNGLESIFRWRKLDDAASPKTIAFSNYLEI